MAASDYCCSGFPCGNVAITVFQFPGHGGVHGACEEHPPPEDAILIQYPEVSDAQAPA